VPALAKEHAAGCQLVQLVCFQLIDNDILPSVHSFQNHVHHESQRKLVFISDHMTDVAKYWLDVCLGVALEETAHEVCQVLERLGVASV
jgi:hypothetical protein